jgi:hypothetical protein
MWRRTAWSVVLGVTAIPLSTLMGQQRDCPKLLVSELSWVRFEVFMGRIVAVTNRAKQDRQRARRELPDGTIESLAVSIDRGLTSLRYARQSETEQINVCVVRRDSVEIRWFWQEPDRPTHVLTYLQQPGADVRMTVQVDGQSPRLYEAPSLWHLLADEPAVRTSPILGLLKRLKPDWRPLAEVDAILAELVSTTPWRMSTSVEEVEQLVKQMSHKKFGVRRWADRELRSRGRQVLCLLDDLDCRLDGEQRMRIREIRRAIEGDESDTPQRVASWLVNDRQIWLALLEHDQLRHRQMAHAHLARIVNRSIDFDPGAEQSLRNEQVASLRTQLALR